MTRPLQLAPAPRRVSTALRLRLLFGGVLNTIGWAITCFGMIFVWVFVGNSELTTLGKFSGGLGGVSAFVTAVEATAMSENDSKVHAVHYEFEVDDRRLSGTSYTTRGVPAEGARVDVEYVVADPSISRIQGMRTAPFPAAVAFVWLFPLIGIGFVAFGLRSGRNAIALLVHGEHARGRLVAKEATNTTVNNQRVFKLTFEFEDGSGATHKAVVRSHLLADLEDEETEALMYDPHRDAAVLLDALPGRPQTDAEGGFDTARPGVACAVLILPILAVVGNGIAYVVTR